MRQTSPLLIGICAVLAVTTLGSLGYVFFGASSDGAVASDAVASQADRPAKVAVIDLEKVAADLGRKEAIAQELQAQKSDLNQKLKEIQTKLQAIVNAEENKIEQVKKSGQQVTPQQKANFTKLYTDANKKLAIEQKKAAILLKQTEMVRVQQFRKEAIAAAKKVAKERGFDMVVAKHPDVILSYDSSFDITNAVIEVMPAATAVAAPASAAPEQPKAEVASYNNQPQPPASRVAQQSNGSLYR